MASRHQDHFNHDADAATYDSDVADETQPIRAGYRALLDWVATQTSADSSHELVELGAGTGNLTARFPHVGRVTAVDTSARMLDIARSKLGDRIAYVQADLLGFFDVPRRFDRIVSTYAVHHLEDDEKHELFRRVKNALTPGGRAVFGDLMFESAGGRDVAIAAFSAKGLTDVVDAIETEYFWLLDDVLPALRNLGFVVETQRFSELSWGVACRVI